MSALTTDPPLIDRRLRVIIDDRPGDPFFQISLEEAILRELNEKKIPDRIPVLRLWRCERSVVMGPGRKIADDVHIEAVETDGIPLVRRSSGGGTVFHHPDNICYSLFLPYTWPELKPRSRIKDSVNLLCGAIVKSLQKYGFSVEISKRSDIMISGCKVSGTAQQRLKSAMCHHGTILLKAHVGEMERYLKLPPERRTPHREFVAGLVELGLDSGRKEIYKTIRDSVCEILNLNPVPGSLKTGETDRARQLERAKYRRDSYTRRLT